LRLAPLTSLTWPRTPASLAGPSFVVSLLFPRGRPSIAPPSIFLPSRSRPFLAARHRAVLPAAHRALVAVLFALREPFFALIFGILALRSWLLRPYGQKELLQIEFVFRYRTHHIASAAPWRSLAIAAYPAWNECRRNASTASNNDAKSH